MIVLKEVELQSDCVEGSRSYRVIVLKEVELQSDCVEGSRATE